MLTPLAAPVGREHRQRRTSPLRVVGALCSVAAAVIALEGASAVSPSAIRGVSPRDLHLYQPIAGTSPPQWQCLNSAITIPFSRINDDYCDCPDGSDEPGTSAACASPEETLGEALDGAPVLADTQFYCANEGHEEAWIRRSRVNDGICDPECCDGTDEYDGKTQCPNTCAKVGKEYRKRKQEEENIRRAGAKIRTSYIAETKKKAEALHAEIATLEVEIEVAREAEKRTKADLESAEQLDKAIIEEKKKSPLYATLRSHQDAMDALLKRENRLRDEMTRLTNLLDDLSSGYNPNYQDMAVKGAVMAYRSWRRGGEEGADDAEADEQEQGDPSEQSSDADGGDNSADEKKKKNSDITAEENVMLKKLGEEGDWPRSTIRDMVSQETLELMDDGMFKGNVADQDNVLFRITEYLPEPLIPLVDNVVDSLLSILLKMNVISGVRRRPASRDSSEPEPESVTAARRAHTDAAARVRTVSSQLSTKRSSLAEDPAKWGREGEWKALEGKCVERNMGEYTYEYCFFGGTTQKPNKGGSNVSMGRFAAFEPADEALTHADDGFFLRQKYARGQRCWNGPERSTIVDLVCGVENALLDVFEAEKCIYSMKVSTPAVCFPPRASSEAPTQSDPEPVPEPAQAAHVKEEL